MITEDNRLDRTVTEEIATTTTLTEKDLRAYRGGEYDDPDHELYADRIDEVVEKLAENETSRRAILLADSPERCIAGVHVLVRDKIHVLAWFRSSDRAEYRDDDLGFLYRFARKVRKKLGMNRRIMLHAFTSSLHTELDASEEAEINGGDNE